LGPLRSHCSQYSPSVDRTEHGPIRERLGCTERVRRGGVGIDVMEPAKRLEQRMALLNDHQFHVCLFPIRLGIQPDSQRPARRGRHKLPEFRITPSQLQSVYSSCPRLLITVGYPLTQSTGSSRATARDSRHRRPSRRYARSRQVGESRPPYDLAGVPRAHRRPASGAPTVLATGHLSPVTTSVLMPRRRKARIASGASGRTRRQHILHPALDRCVLALDQPRSSGTSMTRRGSTALVSAVRSSPETACRQKRGGSYRGRARRRCSRTRCRPATTSVPPRKLASLCASHGWS